jgi:glycosyltransferase involved in cell wall biosynthesis
MKILLFITGLGVGGAETQVTALADSFAAHGHTVVLVSLNGEAHVRPYHPAVTLVELKMKRDPFSFLVSYIKARRLIRRLSPDVIHGHMIHANIFARLLRLTIRIPKLICTSHTNREGGRLRSSFYRYTNHLSDLNTNVSDSAVKAAEKSGNVLPGKMLTVYNGIDTERFQPGCGSRHALRHEIQQTSSAPALLAVGRFAPAKDYPNLFTALTHVVKARPEVRLWIAGAGPNEQECRTIVNELGLVDNVKFLGVRSDIPELMSAADVFVLSSAWEGFGLVVGEAMACGLSVVATDCGGVREVVGQDGVLVPPKDSMALALALLRVLEMSEGERERLGRSARARIVNNYSLNASVQRWLQIYQG